MLRYDCSRSWTRNSHCLKAPDSSGTASKPCHSCHSHSSYFKVYLHRNKKYFISFSNLLKHYDDVSYSNTIPFMSAIHYFLLHLRFKSLTNASHVQRCLQLSRPFAILYLVSEMPPVLTFDPDGIFLFPICAPSG